jgi:carbon storage regulator CsrA
MLVVTRQQGQEVVVGDPKNPLGVIRVAQIRGDRVRLAFEFPKHVQINRREVADQKATDETVTAEIEIKLAEGQSIELPEIIGTIRPKTAAGG